MSDNFSPEAKEIITHLLQHDDNGYCADCGTFSPKWASTTLGVFICLNCSGIHRSLGTHITLVRSCTLDSWTMKQVRVMSRVGNRVANDYWESRLPVGYNRPKNDRYAMERFINDKYVRHLWAADGPPPPFNSKPTERRQIKNIFGSLSVKNQNQAVHKSSSNNTFNITSNNSQNDNRSMPTSSRYSTPNFNAPVQQSIPSVISQPAPQLNTNDVPQHRFAKKHTEANDKPNMPMCDFDANIKQNRAVYQYQSSPKFNHNNVEVSVPVTNEQLTPRRRNEKNHSEDKKNSLNAGDFSLKLHSPLKRQAYEAPVSVQSPKNYFQVDFSKLSSKNYSPKSAINQNVTKQNPPQSNEVEKRQPAFSKSKNSNNSNNHQNSQTINFWPNNHTQPNLNQRPININFSSQSPPSPSYFPQQQPYKMPVQEQAPPAAHIAPAKQTYHAGGAHDLYVQQRRMKRLAEQQAREAAQQQNTES